MAQIDPTDAELAWVDHEHSSDLAELDGWAVEVAQVWERVLAKPVDTERVVVVDAGANEARAGIFFAQAINHPNHHREQVCSILTGFGIEPPDIQAWEYAWETARIWDRQP